MIRFAAILLISLSITPASKDHSELRELFEYSVNNRQKAIEFSKEYSKHSQVPYDVRLAYEGMSYLMLCKHTGSVYDKYDNFVIGKEKLEKAISLSPNNVEFRFLRYGVQYNAPLILQYSSDIESDKQILKQFIQNAQNQQADPWLYRCVKTFLNQTT